MFTAKTKYQNIFINGQNIRLCYNDYEPDFLRFETPVIMVHGLTRQKMDFDYVAQALCQQNIRVMSFDMPGRGGSSWLTKADDYNVPFYSVVMKEVLSHLRLENVHWIGTSMGGLIALDMAQQGYQKLLSSLTLVDITPTPRHEACLRIADYLNENLPILENIDAYIDFIKKNLPLGKVADNVWMHFATHQLVQKADGYHFHFDPKIVPRAKKDLSEKIDLNAALQRLDCPLALVAGGKSDLCTQEEIIALQKIRPELSLFIDEEAGHIPALADKAAHDFIKDFLMKAHLPYSS